MYPYSKEGFPKILDTISLCQELSYHTVQLNKPVKSLFIVLAIY